MGKGRREHAEGEVWGKRQREEQRELLVEAIGGIGGGLWGILTLMDLLLMMVKPFSARYACFDCRAPCCPNDAATRLQAHAQNMSQKKIHPEWDLAPVYFSIT